MSAINAEPDVSEALRQAIIVGQQGRWPEALERMRRLAESAPHNAMVWLWLGYALEQTEGYSAALRAYKAGLEIAPADPDLRQGAARMHARMAEQAQTPASKGAELVAALATTQAYRGPSQLLLAGVAAVVVVMMVGAFAALSVPSMKKKALAQQGTAAERRPGTTLQAREAELKAHLSDLRAAIQAFHGHYGVYPACLQDLVATVPPVYGYDERGNVAGISPDTGPPPCLFSDRRLPADPITGEADWHYETSDHVGAVHSSAPGTDSTGVLYTDL